MSVAPTRVVLDANVLFPFTLRDTLLRAAGEGFFEPLWSEEILDEMRRNLVSMGTTTAEQATRLMAVMQRAFPEALVSGHEALTPTMPNQAKDRHVAAAAVHAQSVVIVTDNLRDFRELPPGIVAISSDTFLSQLVDLDPSRMVALVKAQAAALRRPPRTFEEVVAALRKLAPTFASRLLVQAE